MRIVLLSSNERQTDRRCPVRSLSLSLSSNFNHHSLTEPRHLCR